ncbi:MAG TPA: alpha/beta hydrolase [Stellaceae bacterium]
MPTLKRADAEIYYEEYGSGYPVLLLAPGGMRSQTAMWHSPAGGPPRAWNDWTEVLAKDYRVIAMDQRNAGKSRGAVAANHGWQTYAADQIALLDHLGIARCHTLGGCIGSSFCLMLSQTAPARVSAQVLQNPIGLNPEFPTYFQEAFADWAKELKASRGPSSTMRRSRRSGATCGITNSSTACSATRCRGSRRRASSCRATTSRIRPMPGWRSRSSCRMPRCCARGRPRRIATRRMTACSISSPSTRQKALRPRPS